MCVILHALDAPSDSLQVEKEREEWEREQQREEAQSRSQRSVSRERWVETMVVADSKLIEYHGSENVESYIFTIMNMVRNYFFYFNKLFVLHFYNGSFFNNEDHFNAHRLLESFMTPALEMPSMSS